MPAPDRVDELRCQNQGCRANLASLPAVVPLTSDIACNGLYCPVCGTRTGDLTALLREKAGVFLMGRDLHRWRRGADSPSLQLGSLKIQLPEPDMDLRTVCYPAVPRLLDAEGRPLLPDLPLRPEYLHLLEAGTGTPRVVADRYCITLKLAGQPLPVDVTVPFFKNARIDAIRGLRVALWPRVPLKEWRFFLLGAWLTDAARMLDDGQITITPVVPPDDRRPDDRPLQDAVLGRQAGADTPVPADRSVRQVLGRPSHVAVRYLGADRMEAGGCFTVEKADRNAGDPSRPVTLGIDFGTSNSYVAFQPPGMSDEAREVVWGDLDLVLVNGAPRAVGNQAPETWPPIRGYQPSGSCFPSSLVTLRPTAECNPDPQTWSFGEDFGVGPIGEDLQYKEAIHTVSRLKWGATHTGGSLANDAPRRLYLEALLLLTLANLCQRRGDDTVHFRQVSVYWSYPLAFEEPDYREQARKQQDAFDAACAHVSAWTGFRVQHQRGKDEATVAGQGSIGQSATDALFVDMGGGTVDVFFVEHRKDAGPLDPTWCHARSSFLFAGDDFVHMLCEGGYLALGWSRERFLRSVRSQETLGDRFANESLNDKFREMARARTEMFFDYLCEYLSRLVAARLLDSSTFRLRGSEYTVEVRLLGNGWGFLGLNRASDPHRYVRSRLSARIRELCEKEAPHAPEGCAWRKGIRFAISCEAPAAGMHPKMAVAHGLLKPADHTERKDRSRGILGYTTWAAGYPHEYPWYLPLVDDWDPHHDPRLQGHPRLTRDADLVWRDPNPTAGDPALADDTPGQRGDPGFKSDLPSLFEVDDELKASYRSLLQKVPNYGTGWFGRNVLEVFYEAAVRRQLHRISKRRTL